MNSFKSRFKSFLTIVLFVSFNAAFGMQNQQQQPCLRLGERIGSAIGGGIGGAIDSGFGRLLHWCTDSEYTVGTLAGRCASLPCAAAFLWFAFKATYAGCEMVTIYNDRNTRDYRARTARTLRDAGMDMALYSADAVAAIIASLWLTSNPQRA